MGNGQKKEPSVDSDGIVFSFWESNLADVIISHSLNAVKSYIDLTGVGSPPSVAGVSPSASNVQAAGRASVLASTALQKGETGGRSGPAGFGSSYLAVRAVLCSTCWISGSQAGHAERLVLVVGGTR
jgi:hypothetical protein